MMMAPEGIPRGDQAQNYDTLAATATTEIQIRP
jgi:hypothetical protein